MVYTTLLCKALVSSGIDTLSLHDALPIFRKVEPAIVSTWSCDRGRLSSLGNLGQLDAGRRPSAQGRRRARTAEPPIVTATGAAAARAHAARTGHRCLRIRRRDTSSCRTPSARDASRRGTVGGARHG